nr:hypothetical protein [uncultured Undibacterium sp.]
MSKKHHFIPVSKLRAGMILSENLLDKLGHILLPSGTELTENTIKAMAHHEVHQLAVFSDSIDDDENDNSDIELQQKKIAKLGAIFRHAPVGEPTDMLKMYVEKYRRSKT